MVWFDQVTTRNALNNPSNECCRPITPDIRKQPVHRWTASPTIVPIWRHCCTSGCRGKPHIFLARGLSWKRLINHMYMPAGHEDFSPVHGQHRRCEYQCRKRRFNINNTVQWWTKPPSGANKTTLLHCLGLLRLCHPKLYTIHTLTVAKMSNRILCVDQAQIIQSSFAQNNCIHVPHYLCWSSPPLVVQLNMCLGRRYRLKTMVGCRWHIKSKWSSRPTSEYRNNNDSNHK